METENKTPMEILHVESVPDNVKVTNRAQNFFFNSKRENVNIEIL